MSSNDNNLSGNTGNEQDFSAIDQNVNITSTTQSTSITTGSLRTAGGVGIVKNLNVGGNIVSNGTLTTGNINVGNIVSGTITGTGLMLPAPGGTPTILNNHEIYSVGAVWSGPWSGSLSSTIELERLGNKCYLFVPSCGAGASVSTRMSSAVGTIPSRFYPKGGNGYASMPVVNAGQYVNGIFSIDNTGTIIIGVAGTTMLPGLMSASGIVGMVPTTVVWSV
jgi:hypothetical protein